MPPAARVSDMHTCPMVTPGMPPIPHVGGPIMPPGAPTVMIDFLPAATVSTMATCVGPPDVIVKGSATVIINGLPAARLGDTTAHGGVIVMGSPNVIIGDVGNGGVGSPMAAAMGAANTAAVAASNVNPSKLSKRAKPSVLIAPPHVVQKSPNSAYAQTGKLHSPTSPGHVAGTHISGVVFSEKGKLKRIVCGLRPNSVKVSCQHGRAPQGGLLQVVPTLVGGDMINCSSEIIGTCGQHPEWTVQYLLTSKRVGATDSFRATSVLRNTLGLIPIWLGGLEPAVYNVSVASCGGPTYAFAIEVYPNDKQNFSFSEKIWEEELQPTIDGVKTFLEKFIDHPEFEFLVGSGSLAMQWKEDPNSNLAFYSWSIAASLNPLVSLGFRVPLGPFALPPELSDLGVNAGIYFEVKGEINFAVQGGRIDPPESSEHFNVTSENSILFAILGSVYLGDEDDPRISAVVAIQTGVTLGLTGSMENHRPLISLDELSVGGLKGTVEFHCAFSVFGWNPFGWHPEADFKAECTFCQPYPILSNALRWYPLGDSTS